MRKAINLAVINDEGILLVKKRKIEYLRLCNHGKPFTSDSKVRNPANTDSKVQILHSYWNFNLFKELFTFTIVTQFQICK